MLAALIEFFTLLFL